MRDDNKERVVCEMPTRTDPIPKRELARKLIRMGQRGCRPSPKTEGIFHRIPCVRVEESFGLELFWIRIGDWVARHSPERDYNISNGAVYRPNGLRAYHWFAIRMDPFGMR